MCNQTSSRGSVLLVVIVTAVAAGLVAGGGVYYWQKSIEKTPVSQPVAEPSAVPTKSSATPAKSSAAPAATVKTSNDLLEVTSPIPNQKVTSPVKVSGKSNFFEAHTSIKVVDDNGKVLAHTFATAGGWMDKLYPFSKSVHYDKPSSPKGSVEVFEESAKDGSAVNKVSIPVTFGD